MNIARMGLHVAIGGLNLTPVFLEIFIIFLMCLAYGDVIHVNYGQLAESISGFAKAISPALGLPTLLVSHLPFISGFVPGLKFGFKRTSCSSLLS